MPALKRAMIGSPGHQDRRQDSASGGGESAGLHGVLGLLGAQGNAGNRAVMDLIRGGSPTTAAKDTAGQAIFDAGAVGGQATLPYRAKLESSFGADLSGIEVYQGGRAGAALDQLKAGGAYGDGQILLPHGAPLEMVGEEVAHALQDDGGGGRGVSTGAEPAEQEAREAGRAVAKGEPATVSETTTAGVHRGGFLDWAKDTVSDGASWVGDKASEVSSGVTGAVSSATSWVGDKAGELGSGVTGAISDATSWAGAKVGEVSSGVSGAVNSATSWVGDKAGQLGSGVMDTVDGATGWLGDTVGGGWSALRDGGLGGLGDYASNKLSDAKDGVSGAWNSATGWVGDTVGQAADGVSGAWNSATGWLGDTVGQAADGVSGAWNSATGWLGDTWNQAKDGVSGAWDGVKGWAGDTWNQAKDGVSGAWDGFKDVAKEKFKEAMPWLSEKLLDGASWLNDKYDEFRPYLNKFRGGLDTATDWTKKNVGGALDWVGWGSGADWLNNKVDDVRDLFGLDEKDNSFTHHMEIPQNADNFVQQYSELGVPLTTEAWTYQDKIDGGKLHRLYNTSMVQNLASSNKIDPSLLPEDMNSLSDEQMQSLADKSTLTALSNSGVLDGLIQSNKLDPDSIPDDFSTMDPAELKTLAETVSNLGATQDLFDAMPSDQRTAFQENLLDTYIDMANNDPNAAMILELMPTEMNAPVDGKDILTDALLKGQEPNDFRVGSDTGKIREGSVSMSQQLSDPNGQNKNVFGLVVPYSNSVENIALREGVPTDATEHVHNYLSKLDKDTTSMLTGYSQGGAGVLDYVRTYGDQDGLDYSVALAPMGGANLDGTGGNGVWGGDFNGVRTLSLENKNDPAQYIWGEDLKDLAPGMLNFADDTVQKLIKEHGGEYTDALNNTVDHLSPTSPDRPLGGHGWVHGGFDPANPGGGTYGYPTDMGNLMIRDLLDPSKSDEYYSGSYSKRGEWDWDQSKTMDDGDGNEVSNPSYKMPDPSEYEDWAEYYRTAR